MWNVYNKDGGLIAKDFCSKLSALAWAKMHCNCKFIIKKG